MRIPTWLWTLGIVCWAAYVLYALLGTDLGTKIRALDLTDIIAIGFLGALLAIPRLTATAKFQNDAMHYLVAAGVFVFFGLCGMALAYKLNNTTGATIAAGIFATLGWVYSNYNTNRNQRINHTISILLQMRNSAEYMKNRKVVFDRFPNEKTIPDDAVRALRISSKDEDRAVSDSLTYILNYFEFISLNVLQGNIEDKIIDDTIGGILVNMHRFAEPYIRSGRSDDWGNINPRLYEHMERLALEYKARRQRTQAEQAGRERRFHDLPA